MSDQELDDLFKEASSKYEAASYSDKEWEKMEALLDKPHSVRTPFWNWKTVGIAALLITMSGALLLISWNETSKEQDGIATDALNKDTMALKEKPELTIIKDRATKNRKNEVPSSPNLPSAESGIKEKTDNKDDAPSGTKHESVVSQKGDHKKRTSQGNDDKAIINETDDGLKNGDYENTNSKFNNEQGFNAGNVRRSIAKSNEPVRDNAGLQTEGTKDRSKENRSVTPEQKKQTNETVKSLPDGRPELLLASELPGMNTNGVEEDEKVMQTAENIYELEPADKKILESEANNIAKPGHEPYNPTIKDSARVVVATVGEVKDSLVNHDRAARRGNKKDTLDKIHRFSIRLSLSPDFSSVGYFKPGKTGFNYGLLTEYNITRHWSVTAGAIWSKKIYSDLKTESSGYGTVNSTQLKGSCRVLDLPLNINYYFTPQNTVSVYTSVGLSSYLMFDEDYTYNYVNGPKTYSYAQKIAKGNTEWFKMMNVSIGIQQQLSSQLKLQLEPFVKAPLSGIGGGDLKLVSSGVFVNLKYTFK